MDSLASLPADRFAWESQRQQIRGKLYETLGDLPPLFTPNPIIINTEQRDGYRLEKFTFPNSLGDTVFGYCLVPDQPNGAAVLYCHYHGGKYDLGKDEMFDEPLFGDWVGLTPRGIALVQAGYVVLAVDSYAFGERQHQGPAGDREAERDTEFSLSKRFLWQGTSLWGLIVHDDLLALNYLLSRPEVNESRVAVTGASMGGSRATWVAALDDRVKVVAPVIQYTRYRNLLAAGGLGGHSFYYYVPGALTMGFDMEGLVSLAAPRPQIVLVGDSDPLSPADGIAIINDYARAIYRLYGAEDHFQPHVYSGLGHSYTPEMFATLLEFLKNHL